MSTCAMYSLFALMLWRARRRANAQKASPIAIRQRDVVEHDAEPGRDEAGS